MLRTFGKIKTQEFSCQSCHWGFVQVCWAQCSSASPKSLLITQGVQAPLGTRSCGAILPSVPLCIGQWAGPRPDGAWHAVHVALLTPSGHTPRTSRWADE